MSIFLRTNHAFCRSPDAEGAAALKAASFGAVFVNIGDYPLREWEYMRDECRRAGSVCGPWLRTQGADREFDPGKLSYLVEVADDWNPDDPVGICNSEKEIDATGSDITSWIARQIGDRDFGISSEIRPYMSVDWHPLGHLPVLPQRFPAEQAVMDDDNEIRRRWWEAGFSCVVITYGTYHGMQPTQFPRLSPYGIYTADDCLGEYMRWQPVGEIQPCKETEVPDMAQMIGSQHGIEAMYQRLKKLDPEGCNPEFDPAKPAALPVQQLKAYDKWARTMQILVKDHDASV